MKLFTVSRFLQSLPKILSSVTGNLLPLRLLLIESRILDPSLRKILLYRGVLSFSSSSESRKEKIGESDEV